MDNENECMLKEITHFLIKVGEHCITCEGKITIEPEIEIQTKQNRTNVKLSYLEKWIKKNPYMEVFTLDQFFKEFPKQKKNRKLKTNISNLISENKILQLSNNKFKVV